MGFFSKVFKGVKKVFKKIGKGIKKVVGKVGKFMNKIGIVGQIALMFLPLGPVLGSLLKGAGGIAAKALTAMGPIGAQILKGAQFVIGKAGTYVTSAKTAFGTVTEGVSNFVSEFTKTGLNKIGFDATKFGFKAGGGLDTWVKSGSNSFGEAWGKVTTNITENAGKILDPFKSSITAGQNTTLESISDSAFHSVEDIQRMNPQITDWGNIDGQLINLDSEFPINQMVPQGGFKTKVTTQQQYDQFWNEAASGMESKAVSELGSSTSLLAKYQDNPISGPMTEQSAADFKRILDSQDIAAPLGESTGFFDSKLGKAAQGVGTSVATTLATDAARSAFAGDLPEAPYSGYPVNAGQTLVQGAGQAVDYGIGAQFTPQSSSPATGLYDGRNTYAATFRALYGATG